MIFESNLASSASITKFGSFLRKTKLDELLQLWNILKDDASLVGPHSSLFNQPELTKAREAKNVYAFLPGITGEAQVNEIDISTPYITCKNEC